MACRRELVAFLAIAFCSSCADGSPVGSRSAESRLPVEGELSGNPPLPQPEFSVSDTPPSVRDRISAARAGMEEAEPSGDEHFDPSEYATRHAAALLPQSPIRIVLRLEEASGFNAEALRSASATERRAIIEDRKAETAAVRAPVVSRLESVGGTNIRFSWSNNTVGVSVPASVVRDIRSWSNVRAISLPAPTRELTDGIYSRWLHRTEDIIAAGKWAGDGSRADGGEIRIGLIDGGDEDYPFPHPVFEDWDGGPSRVVKQYDCYGQPCSECGPSECAELGTQHGMQTAWAAAGSIEQGQDPDAPGSGTQQQVSRSGHAREAEVYYYAAQSSEDIAAAIDQAFDDDVDVLALPFSIEPPGGLDPGYDTAFINESLRLSADTGIIITASAGNDGWDGSPVPGSIEYPAWRPDVLAVGGTGTGGWHEPPLYAVTPEEDDPHGSSRGPFPIEMVGGSSREIAGVSFTAQAVVTHYPQYGLDRYNEQDKVYGTSFSSPIASGVAGLLREALDDAGRTTNAYNARELFATMLVLGDTWNADDGSQMASGVSPSSGFGRLRTHWPSDDNLTAPWGWGVHSFTISDGETVSWPVGDSGPEDSNLTQWKWAVTWFPEDMTSVNDITIEVVDTCVNPGEQVAWDQSFDTAKRIHLREDDICIVTGCRCLEMRAYGWDVEGTETIYTADYFHSGSTAWH